MTEQVIIEFVSDSTGLQPAEDKLAAIGKIDAKTAQVFKQTNTELQKRVQFFNSFSQSTAKAGQSLGGLKNNILDLDKYMKSFVQNFSDGWKDGVIDALKEAGFEFDETTGKIKTGSEGAKKSTDSLRTQLKRVTDQMGLLVRQGKENTDQYKALAKEAGNLKNAMGDVSATIQTLGSDTQVFDGLLNAAQGVAGAFAVAQGTTALFGDENEELQEVLLRVNAAMAILQGLQAVSNVLQKESAASLLVLNIQQRIHNAQLVLENALQARSVIVRGLATAAQKALNFVMSINPIGLMVTALAGLVIALDNYSRGAREAARDTAALNSALSQSTRGLDAAIEGIGESSKKTISDLRVMGASGSRIMEQELIAQRAILSERERDIANLRNVLATAKKGEEEVVKAANDRLEQLENDAARDRAEIYIKENEIKIALREEDKAADEKAIAEREKRDAKAREARLQALNDELAALEKKALQSEKGGQIEVTIQKKIVAAKAKIELEQEKLTANQKLLIAEKSLQDQLTLQKEFNKKSSQEAIEALISRNNAELQNLNLQSDERLRLTIENLISQAQIEIDANEGNASKIKEINAKRDADIKAARLKSIQETLDYEIALQDAREGANQRTLQAIAANEKASLDERIAAIDELTNYELEQLKKRQDALDRRLSGDRQYNLLYEQLQDQQAKISEDAEKKKQDAIDKTAEKAKQRTKEIINTAIDVAGQVVGVIDALFKLQSDKENNRISEQKKQVEELREAGVITEKEAIKRMKVIEAEEKRIKRQQAQRDKQVAIFQAIINTAAGVAKAIPNIALMAIAAAIGAAQIAIIASRPIPKFKKGKKDQYEGLGEVGEAGAELIEKDGRMYVADKPTVIWLGKKDKVYNPAETQRMMKQQPTVNKSLMQVTNNNGHAAMNIDYEKLGKSVGKNIPQPIINITEKGMTNMVKQGNTITEYIDKRRSWR